jgi:hypothetical protein
MASRAHRHHFRPSTNCYKLSGLLLPLAVVLGVAASCTAAGVREPLFSGVNVNGLRLRIDVSSTFTRLDVYAFGCLHVCAFVHLRVWMFAKAGFASAT